MTTTIGQRVKACRTALGMSQRALAELSGLQQPTLSSLEAGRSNTSGSLASIAAALQVSALWLETGRGEKEVPGALESTGLRQGDTRGAGASRPAMEFDIPVLQSTGSCGNGKPHFDDVGEFSNTVTLSERFATSLRINPSTCVAVYADGDSMENFIVDGDLLIFDTHMDHLRPRSIYLIETPDGLRVKRVNRRIDGQIILSSDNPNKSRYPDEIYTQDQASELNVKGRFVCRMGGSI